VAIARRLAPLTRDSLDEIPAPCRTCTRWELDAVHRSRVEADGGAGDAKAAWLSSTLLDWGSCGQVVRVDGEVAPVSPDAVALAALRVEPEHADHGLARMLVQGMAADLARRGVRAVEAIASATPGAVDCLVPADFLLAVGFTTVRPHPRTPRLRLDLRSTAAWREDVVEAALERLLGRRRAVGTLHREDPTG